MWCGSTASGSASQWWVSYSSEGRGRNASGTASSIVSRVLADLNEDVRGRFVNLETIERYDDNNLIVVRKINRA